MLTWQNTDKIYEKFKDIFNEEDNNDPKITINDYVSEVLSNEKVENITEQRYETAWNITTELVKYDGTLCNFSVTRQQNLLYHFKSLHKGVKFICQWCQYIATSKSDLNIHIQLVHEEVNIINQEDVRKVQGETLEQDVTEVYGKEKLKD